MCFPFDLKIFHKIYVLAEISYATAIALALMFGARARLDG